MKLKRLLSIALPILGIATATAVAAPLVVSCSSSSPEQKPSAPDNGGNGSGGSNNGGGSTTTPETKPEVNEKFFTYTQDKYDTRITGLTAEGQKQTKITIPATINDVKVTWIDFGFGNDTAQNIQEFFFEAPENIISINFRTAISLQNVNFLSKLTNLQTIDHNCFEGFGDEEKDKRNIFPSTLDLSHTKITSIGEAAFKDTNIQTILWPQTLQGIGNEAFSNTHIDDKSVNGLSSILNLESIGQQAFANCPNLTNIDWSAMTGKYIAYFFTGNDWGVFYNCINLNKIIYNKNNNVYRDWDDKSGAQNGHFVINWEEVGYTTSTQGTIVTMTRN